MNEKPEKRPKGLGHKTVRITKGMAESITEFLETDGARSLGFDSRADVVTAGARLLLTQLGFFPIKHTGIAECFRCGHVNTLCEQCGAPLRRIEKKKVENRG